MDKRCQYCFVLEKEEKKDLCSFCIDNGEEPWPKKNIEEKEYDEGEL